MRHVQSVINSISNVEVWANGATGLLNANSLNSLKTAVSGLSKEQALLVLSTKNLTQAQKEQVLIEAGIIASNDKINASMVQRALAESTLTAEQQKDILTKLELINVETGEVITTNACTKAALEEALAKKGIVGTDAEAIISSMGLTSANATQTISFDLLTASIWANIKALGKWLVTNPVGWAILGGTAILSLAKAYDEHTDSVEEVKEKTDSLLQSYKSAISEANTNAKTIESLASRYETLSKGVNNLGENVSLTADEYSEYNDIVNQIAEMFPTMITGYTDEGNAILSLKGNVEELRDAYKEAQKEAYNLLIVSGKDNDGNDIITNYRNQLYGNSKSLTVFGYESGAKDVINILTRLQEASNPEDFAQVYQTLMDSYIEKNLWATDKIQDALNSSGISDLLKNKGFSWDGALSQITQEDLDSIKYNIQSTIQIYQAEIDSQLQNVRTIANAYLMTNSDYEKLDEQSKTAASLLVNSIDESIANGFENKSDVGAYVAELITSISNSTEAQKALTNLFTMDTSNMSIGEIQSEVDSYISTIATAIGEDHVELKVRLGFDDDNTEQLKTKVQGFLKDEYDDKVGTLTKEDLDIASKLEIPEGTLLSWDELIVKIEEAKNASPNETNVLSFDEAWASLKNVEDSDSALKNTRNDLEELANAGKLTNESFKNVTGFEEFLDMIGLSSKEIDIVVSKINSLADGADQLNSMNNGISGLSKNLGTKKESPKDAIDINTISGMDEALKSCTEEWENYVNVVGDASSTYDEVLKATNELATAYINSNNFLSNLTEENKDYYESQLKLMGVENASEVVKSALAKVTYEQAFAEEKLRIKSEDSATVEKAKSIIVSNLDSKTGQLTNTTYSQIAALIQEKGYTDLSKEAFFNLIISMDTFNGTGLDVNQKIGALKELIGWAYSAKAALEFESQTTVSNKGAIYSSATVSAEKAVENIQNRYNKNDVKLEAPIISPISNSSGSDGSGGSGGSGSDSGSNTKEEIDWIEIRLESLQKKAEEVIDTIDKKVTLKQANKAIKESIKLTNTYLDNLEKAKEKYFRYFNEVDLSSAYKELIKNGKMDIQTITDENLKTQIQKAQELWDKYQGCVDSIKEQKQQLKELNQMKLDKITEFYDKQQDLYESSISTEESKIKYKEDAGIVVKESDYNTAINDAKKNENSRLKELNKFKKELDKQKKKGLRGSELKERQAELEQKYQEYYDSRSKRIELEQQQSDIALTKLQNERELLESNMNKWQSVIDLKEAHGKEITKKDYQKMITNAEKQNKSYEDQNKILLKQQKNVKKYSARWYELQGEINSNNDAIQKNIISMEEYSDSIDNIKLNKLERQLELLNSIHGIYSDILSFREAQGQDKKYSEYLEQIANNREEIKTLDAEIAEKDRLIANEDPKNTVKIEELRKERAELESQRWNLKADNETLWKEAITSPLTDALDKISDELSDMNEKLNEQRDLEEAQYNLQKAQNQKNQLVLTKDGFKYQSDLDAVKEAQQKLDDIKYQKAIDKLEEIKEVIEKIAKESTIYDKNGNWIGYDDATLKKINSLILPVLNSNMYSDEQKNGLKNIVQELLNPKSDPVNSAINKKYTENTSSVNKNDGMVLEKVQTPLLTSMENMANLISGNMLNIINTYSVAEKTLNSIHPKKINTATTFTGDIVIKESVDNVETFADAILKNLPNAVNRKLNKN